MAAVIGSGALLLGGAGQVAASAGPSRPQAPATTAMCGTLKTAPTIKHVVIIMEENNSYSSIYKSASAPYINSVIGSCGLATAYHNVTHPSLPNYLALTYGGSLSQLQPFIFDCTPSPSCQLGPTTNNVFNELTGHGGWKGYDESMPTACDKSDVGNYAPRHNPAVYYTDLKTCSANDVPLGTTAKSALLTAFGSEATAPALAFVTPNLCDDMHGGTGCPSNLILGGDNWLKSWLPLLTGTAVYKTSDTAVFIVWDEGSVGGFGENCATSPTDQSCHVVAMAVAPSVKKGTMVATQFTHYSLLKTVEDLLHVPELGLAKTATSMVSGFNL